MLLGAACYLNTLPNGFVYDDIPLVQRNPRIRSLANLREIWLSDWWRVSDDMPEGASPLRDRLYRPLTLQSFAMDHAVFGVQPLGYHAVNIFLHAVACGLLWVFARRITQSEAVATIAAIVFAVHPVHAEAVASIVGRAEILAAAALLSGLIALYPPGQMLTVGRTGLAAVAFLAAIFSKETAVCYPLVAGLVLVTQPGIRGKKPSFWLWRAGILLLPLVVYLPLRYAVLDGRLFRTAPADVVLNPLVMADAGQRVLGALEVLGQYTRLILVPARLSCDYGIAVVDPQAGVTGMTLLGLAGAGGLLAALAVGRRRGGIGRCAALLAAIFLASYALISNTVLLIGVSLAERLAYWPSVPLLILVAVGVVEFWRRQCGPGRPLEGRRKLLGALGVLLLAALGLRTVVRSGDWSDNLTLFGRDVAANPRSAQLQYCYAGELADLATTKRDQAEARKVFLRADKHLEAALRIDPAYADALALRGQVLAAMGDLESARLFLEAGLHLKPEHAGARRTLQRIVAGAAPDPQQVAALRAAAASQPTDPAPLIALGRVLLEGGEAKEALGPLEQAAALSPQSEEAAVLLARAVMLAEPGPKAIAAYERVLALDRDNWEAHANLANLLSTTDPVASLQHAKRAYELRPTDLAARTNLAEAYALCGERARAIEMYRALEHDLSPDDPYREVVRLRIERLESEGR